MNISTERRIRQLLKRSAGYLGMIREIQSKILLLKNQVSKGFSKSLKCDWSDTNDDQFIDQVQSSLDQMKIDLAKYSRKLKSAYKELKSYGVFSDMD